MSAPVNIIKIGEYSIPYRVKKRDVKYIRLEFSTGKLNVIAPGYRAARKTVNNNKNWIYRKYTKIQSALREGRDKVLNYERDREELKKIAERCIRIFSGELDVKVNKLFVREMSTKWGSLSSKNNITINSKFKFLPLKLIEYVLYHETAHLKFRKHNKDFWELIRKKFNDYKKYEEELFSYWIIMQGNAA